MELLNPSGPRTYASDIYIPAIYISTLSPPTIYLPDIYNFKSPAAPGSSLIGNEPLTVNMLPFYTATVMYAPAALMAVAASLSSCGFPPSPCLPAV